MAMAIGGRGALLALAGLLGLGLCLRWLAGPAPEAALAAPVAAAPATPPPGLPRSPAEAARQQQEAAAATLHELGRPPLRQAPRQRPAFVSETEWQVLTALARQSPDAETMLTRLVNRLRFHKRLELWRAPAALPSAAARDDLARALLDELPERVRNMDVSHAEAEALQRELLATLEPDADRRRARAAQEAKRLPTLLQPAMPGTPVP